MQAEQLERYLREKLPQAGALRVSNPSRFSVGASRETWGFDASWEEAGAPVTRNLILRRDTEGGPVESELELEYRVYCALQGTNIPVPVSYWYENDPRWVGRPFFIMGRVVDCESSPQVLIYDPAYAAGRAQLGERFLEIIANLHALDWRKTAFAEFLAAPPLERAATSQLDYWEDVLNRVELEPQPLLRGIFQWLRERIPPPPARLAVIHGDARMGNFLATTGGEIRAMLDWELAHLGDPLEDVAWAMHKTFSFGMEGSVGGMMSREEYLSRYQEMTGTPTDAAAIQFWEVFAGLKLAVILLTGGRAFVDGRSRSMTLLSLARTAPRGAVMALDCMGVLEGER